MKFTVTAQHGAARVGVLELPHATVETPAFMPVGTLGTVKAMLPQEMEAMGVRLLLNNAFHLYLRPGAELVREGGGLHSFQAWPHGILTDSGGYQVFSLATLRKVTEEGVHFRSPLDGSAHLFTPESVTALQEQLQPDIAMVLDEVVANPATHAVAGAAMERSMRWARRALESRREDGQTFFGIVQGGLYPDLRLASVQATTELDFPGYAIGGLSVGEPPDEMYPIVAACCQHLPVDRPRYLMGVGTPEDLRRCVALGVDMFDCVLPTRLARHGVAWVPEGRLNMLNACHRRDFRPLQEDCACPACRKFTRAYIHHLCKAKEINASRLLTWHNLQHYQQLMRSLREAIVDA